MHGKGKSPRSREEENFSGSIGRSACYVWTKETFGTEQKPMLPLKMNALGHDGKRSFIVQQEVKDETIFIALNDSSRFSYCRIPPPLHHFRLGHLKTAL